MFLVLRRSTHPSPQPGGNWARCTQIHKVTPHCMSEQGGYSALFLRSPRFVCWLQQGCSLKASVSAPLLTCFLKSGKDVFVLGREWGPHAKDAFVWGAHSAAQPVNALSCVSRIQIWMNVTSLLSHVTSSARTQRAATSAHVPEGIFYKKTGKSAKVFTQEKDAAEILSHLRQLGDCKS